jgi:phage gpG-like protein
MTTTLTAEQHIAELLTFANQSPDFSTALRAAGPILREDELRHFDTETAPDGSPWQPLAPATVQRKGFATILVETGPLKAAATTLDAPGHVERVEGNELTYGVDGVTEMGGIPWASVQQVGSSDGRIPARPFMGVSEGAADKLAESAADAELAKWQ